MSFLWNMFPIYLCYIRIEKFGRWALALHHPIQVSQVFEANGRGKAASTRGTRYIALHPRHCAGFSVVRVSEMLHSRARRADDRTSGGGERDGGGDNAISSPIRNCWRLRAALAEMSIRFFGYFVGRRYLASCTSNWAFQISSRLFPPSRFSRLRFDCTSWPAPRPSSYFSHYFSESPPPSPLPSSPPPCALPPVPSLLSRPGSFVPNASTLARNRV